jgi:ribosomal protein S5
MQEVGNSNGNEGIVCEKIHRVPWAIRDAEEMSQRTEK